LVTALWRARRILRELDPGIVHGHSFHANIFARLVCRFAGRLTVLSTIHNVYEGGWIRMMAYRFTDHLCAHTTAVSKAAADRFIGLMAVRAKKCSVVSNAIDIEEFAPNAERRLDPRESLGADDNFVWLAVGRVAPGKDYPNLLPAFTRILEHDPNAHLWIAGEGSDTMLRQEIRRSSKEMVWRQIECLGLRRDLPALLDGADGFVSSSAWEGMPLSIAEAMAMEKPVVATDVGGVRELVGDCAVLVPARDPEALSQAMLEVMQKPIEERKTLGRLTRERIAAHFDIEKRADEWEALYKSLLAAVPAQPAQP
jgi:glycosyltransferase involved in cell wall biosynthesis